MLIPTISTVHSLIVCALVIATEVVSVAKVIARKLLLIAILILIQTGFVKIDCIEVVVLLLLKLMTFQVLLTWSSWDL